MNVERMTQRVQEALNAAYTRALRTQHADDARAPAGGDPRSAGGHCRAHPPEGRRRSEPRRRRRPQAIAALPRLTGPERRPGAGNGLAGADPAAGRAETEAKSFNDEYVSVEHLLLAMVDAGAAWARHLPRCGTVPRETAGRAARRSAATSASPRRIPKARTSRSSATAATSRAMRSRANSIRSSAATRRSAASSKCSRGAPKTTRSSSASPASAKPRSSRAWRSASCAATCPKD